MVKKEIKEKLEELFGLMMTRSPFDKVAMPPIEVFPVKEILELFEEEKKKWEEEIERKSDTNIKSQFTFCEHEWAQDTSSTASVWRCIKCGFTMPRPII